MEKYKVKALPSSPHKPQYRTVKTLKTAVFWDVAPRTLIETDRRFGDVIASSSGVIEAVITSETSVNFSLMIL
jgi:hypothetical protein